ncbi:MAG TPA: TIGR04372 family glycosyltransferase [Roseiarcus sp.]|nr:TIGR04372 family glycosyltransferase [Roseiarcus sp.]
MTDFWSRELKPRLRQRIGVDRAIALGEQIRAIEERIKRLTRFFRPGYWASVKEYRQFIHDGYRLVKISNPQRIGHLCLEVDALLKDRLMRGLDVSKLILTDEDRFANRHIVQYFKKYVAVQKPSPVFDFVRSYGDPEGAVIETHPYAVAMYATATAYDVYAKWGDRPPLFELVDEDRRALNDYLRDVGAPADAWYVCVHAREGGYSPEDESIHRYRSVDIASFSLAMDEIVRRGGWCIRVGDPSMRPLTPRDRVVDYAISAKKSPRLDIALAAGCRFFLGSASGLFNVAEMFGRPCVIAHVSPLSCAYGFMPQDISIPQRLKRRGGGYLALSDIMKSRYAIFRSAREFETSGLENAPNTAEDIRDATVEMLDRLDGKAVYSEEDKRRQEEFRSYFREGHYGFGAAASIGRDFLRKYAG